MKYDQGKRRSKLFRQPKRRGPLLPISLVIIALLILLFSLIQPFQFITNINPANVVVPTFTPTATPLPLPTDVHGGHIVFTCTRQNINQICIINADGSGYRQLTQVTTNAYYPVIAPDSSSVVYAVNQYDNFDLYQYNLRNNKITRLTSNLGNSFSPDYSPDGKQIVFANKGKDGPSSLWVVNSDGKNPHQLYAGPKNIVGAAWSPDGHTIAFAMSVELQYAYEIFLLDANHPEQPPRRITHGLSGIGGSLSWSPDGKNLLIFAGPGNAREVYRLDIASGAITQLTFDGNNASAAYAPDGTYIVYNSLRDNDQADLFIMRANGHSTRRLTDNPEPDWQPQWGP